ncbi:LacI family DNA-binding transcriptional regulator [Demequina pelophila]|uniref:LacI family DNA-binding transcriptional regulator n=1 Tax=Demequina pelophila TaxID=1638984 RepID=UPI000782CC24|nr:LacI family DNA-binding transcriptional regulator [Demequina pelophila]
MPLPSRPAGRPSLRDVATLAGVSGQTVSRVANGSPKVRPDTRRRVREAMAQLGYMPNTAARALRSGSYGTIGVISHQLARTGESRVVESISRAARATGRSVTLLDVESTAHEDVEAAASQLSLQSIDGLIILRAEVEDVELLELPPHLPAVIMDASFGGRMAMVGADHAGGARAAVEHLLSLGHRTVHHLAGPENSIPARARLSAWRETLEAAGREVPDPVRCGWTAESGHAAGADLAAREDVTAVFCASDEIAAGLLLALREAGRDVPGDVSVVGFDDIPLARYLAPPLTTVHQPFAEVGAALVERLFAGGPGSGDEAAGGAVAGGEAAGDEVAGGAVSGGAVAGGAVSGGEAPGDDALAGFDGAPQSPSLVRCELVVRGSTAPPR